MVVLVVCGRARLAVVLLLVVRISGQALEPGESFTCEFCQTRKESPNYVKLPSACAEIQTETANSKTSAGRVGRPPGAAADSTEMLFDIHGVSHRE
jgi:hypothetical protein